MDVANARDRDSPRGSGRALALIAVVLWGCRVDAEPQPTVRVQALLPVAAFGAAPDAARSSDPACERVEQEARKLDDSLPKQLDADTSALRVTARGCDLTLEYQLLTLAAVEVPPSGVLAMRDRVVSQLCADPAARSTLDRGGSFTNIYRDRARAHVGQFTVSDADCEQEMARSAR